MGRVAAAPPLLSPDARQLLFAAGLACVASLPIREAAVHSRMPGVAPESHAGHAPEEPDATPAH